MDATPQPPPKPPAEQARLEREAAALRENLRRRTNKAMVCEDGNGWSLDLNPKFKTDRDLLRIHPDGNVPGTEGCIGPDCRHQQQVYDALRDYFSDKNNKQIPVIVVYPK